MNDPQPRACDQPPMSSRERVDRICDEFERQWKAELAPQIELFLVRADDGDRELLLRELMTLEMALRVEAGQPVDPQEYHGRFAGDRQIVDSAVEAFEEHNNANQTLQLTVDCRHDDDSYKTPRVWSAPDEDVPRTLGRYNVLRFLGRGGFAKVYLARDPELDREVALKVPRIDRFDNEAALEFFVAEARKAAQLDHPGIVRVYDVQREGGRIYIVQQYLAGGDLAQHIESHRLAPARIAELMIAIAEAVGYAHQQRYTHLDLKPANILLDRNGNPYVADFGLALHETMQRDMKGQILGTHAYMSPAQARGEVHRLDGRSDIWSLGIILYELLVGRRPFTGKTRADLLDQIEHHDPRPPRQVNPDSPRELSRICMACLAKRACDRYPSTADLIDDLRHWLEENTRPAKDGVVVAESDLSVDRKAAKVIPQGLRSFEADHADFYLTLLPGPHDRRGLPRQVRFWKTRIEKTDPEETFSVGLMYGPSGCGKSSLVKAGLLPLLRDEVLPIYVEATAADTEVRLIKALRSRCPELPLESSLTELVAHLRKHRGSRGRKVLIVLDQFEQWLHVHESRFDSQLIDALRHCDGIGIQCLVLVRDDFYASLNRFFQRLEIPIVEGHNSALVDLFDAKHARNVLAAFGRAYDQISEPPSTDQTHFIEQAVEGLADKGKVVCVRLALFAEMMKSRPWTEEGLAEVGGTGGVGVTFLEETFSAKTAPPSHRLHQNPVRAVLSALLPELGTDIKGQMKSYDELLKVSGCLHRPADFEAVLRILDGQVRLITPTEPDELPGEDSEPRGVDPSKYYQLSHDYLVPSLRQWLTGKRKLTYKGRAQLKLEEYAGLWSHHRADGRFLPGLLDLLAIRLWTRPAQWNDTQSKMMRRATFLLLRRGTMVLAVALLLGLAGLWGLHHVRTKAHNAEVDQLLEQLWTAQWRRLPDLIRESGHLRPTSVPRLNEALVDGSLPLQRRARAAVFLGPDLSPSTSNCGRQLLDVPLDALPLATERLESHGPHLANHLLATVRLDELSHQQRLAYGVLLAAFAPTNDTFPSLAPAITGELISADPLEVGKWVEALLPVGHHLAVPLEAEFRGADANRRAVAASALQYFIRFAPDAYSDEFVIGLVLDADQRQYPIMISALQCIDAKRARIELRNLVDREIPLEATDRVAALIQQKANACAALYSLGEETSLWDHLDHSQDPRLRTQLIANASSLRVPIVDVLRQLESGTNESMAYGLILALESYVSTGLSPEDEQTLRQVLERIVERGDDRAVCSACLHLLSVLSPESRNELIANSMVACEVFGRPDHCLVRLAAPGTFEVGSPVTEKGRDGQHEAVHSVAINYDFAISTCEVTAGQFQRYDPGFQLADLVAPSPSSPATGVSAYDAMKFCRWLSEELALPEEEMCYPEVNLIGPEMTLGPDFYLRSGFRLPREQEWEFAARAGTKTSRFFGHADHDLMHYACFALNSNEQTRPVGSFRPNPFGLFDVYGNVAEWCHAERGRGIQRGFVSRGGSYRSTPRFVRSASVYVGDPGSRLSVCGFRIVRTIRVD